MGSCAGRPFPLFLSHVRRIELACCVFKYFIFTARHVSRWFFPTLPTLVRHAQPYAYLRQSVSTYSLYCFLCRGVSDRRVILAHRLFSSPNGVRCTLLPPASSCQAGVGARDPAGVENICG